ncbi:hypothetical protein Tco_0667163 [Tanacetum coccineum]
MKFINMVNAGANCKRLYEKERSGLTKELTFPVIPQNNLMDKTIILEGIIEGHQVRRIHIDGGSSSEIMYEHYFKNISANVRSRLRKCKSPLVGFSGEVYHPLGLIDLQVTMGEPGRSKMVLMEFAIHAVNWLQTAASKHPPEEYGRICIGMLRRTAVTRFFMEHQLKTYPLAEPVTYKKRPLTPDRRQALKEKVFKWLKEGIIRRVQHPEWVTNAILVKMANGAWHVHIDYSSLNRICAKDMYPFPEVEEELASLMGYPYKCFLQLPTENSQIRMVEGDEEKTRFHTE